jgi:hypothetical protein
MADPLATAVETFSAPIEELIIALGQGVAEAQKQLDQNSIAIQELMDTDPTMSKYGMQATWYQFPTVNMQLKMSLSITQDSTTSSSPDGPSPNLAGGRLMATPFITPRYRIIAQPLSASFQNHFNYDAQAATQINLTMVPVPAPRAGDQVSSPPAMTAASVQAVAFASGAPFVTTKNAQGATVDAKGNVYAMLTNFNAAARAWYVLQYAPSNAAITPVVVAVDDVTQTARIISTP